MSDFIHPETGELLATREEWAAALETVEKRLTETYHVLWPLREGYAERFEPAPLPRARDRSPTQERVARCPRCGERLEERDASTT